MNTRYLVTTAIAITFAMGTLAGCGKKEESKPEVSMEKAKEMMEDVKSSETAESMKEQMDTMKEEMEKNQ